MKNKGDTCDIYRDTCDRNDTCDREIEQRPKIENIKKLAINKVILKRSISNSDDSKIRELCHRKRICYLKAKDIILSNNLLKFY